LFSKKTENQCFASDIVARISTRKRK